MNENLRNFIDVLQKYYNVVEIWHPSDKEGTYRLLVVQEFQEPLPLSPTPRSEART